MMNRWTVILFEAGSDRGSFAQNVVNIQSVIIYANLWVDFNPC